jgi:uncharacterized peroxidase-related enzyme
MWIKTVEPEAAAGALEAAYQRQLRSRGEVSEFTRLGSLYPDLVAARLEFYKVVDSCPSAIPVWAKHTIALTTSVLNRTPHCASGLGEKLREAGGDPGLVEAVYDDPLHASTGDPRVDALLSYTRKLVLEPLAIEEVDVERLRQHGWSDLDILDANNIASYYCYINRVANGLGLKTLTCPAPEMR